MTKVFIAGSRRLSRLNADVKRRIDTTIEKDFTILVGDANGADKAVQRYLAEKGLPQRHRPLHGEQLPQQRCRLADA
jgi:hypothetical protein